MPPHRTDRPAGIQAGRPAGAVNPKQAGLIAGRRPYGVRLALASGQWPFFRCGGRTLIPLAAVVPAGKGGPP
jgi:hypothetical protein